MADHAQHETDQPVAHQPAHAHFQPAGQRLVTLDALRGFAILGILVPNIFVFAWPMAAMMDPTIMGDTPWNRFAHSFNGLVFHGKFMFNFAMLFGAGVILFDRKTTPTDRKPHLTDGWGLWYRRCAVLMVFGLIHAYFFWFGDILFTYALAGLSIVWWIRKLPTPLLIWGGLALYALGALVMIGFTFVGVWAFSAGKVEMSGLSGDSAAEFAGYLGSWWDALKVRAGTAIFMQFFILFFLPAIVGIMTLGMGLTKAGVLTGERSTRFHATLCVSMLLLGSATTALTWMFVHSLELEVPVGFVWQGVTQFVGVPLAIGYSQLIILACRSRALRGPVKALSNVGRMAMTNYFLHTLICTTLFYGYGFGQYGSISFPQLYGVVVGVWIVNFAFSALWLRYFRFGPFEWLWRQITYLGLAKG